jgi:hypothetical protein
MTTDIAFSICEFRSAIEQKSAARDDGSYNAGRHERSARGYGAAGRCRYTGEHEQREANSFRYRGTGNQRQNA